MTIRAAKTRPRSAPQSSRPRAVPSRSATGAKRFMPLFASSRPATCLLVAGKGHETGQIIRDQILPFSDHEEVAAALKELAA